MSFTERRHFYREERLDKNVELDYLSSTLNGMRLSTVETYRITAVTAHRPDILSFMYYGTYHLGWLLAHHNDFLDPISDFSEGTLLRIPSLTEYYQYYNRNTRG